MVVNSQQACCRTGTDKRNYYDAEYMARLIPRVIARNARPETPSTRRAKAVGRYWQRIRREQGKTRAEVAEGLGVPRYVVALVEQGLLPHEDLPGGYIARLSKVLGRVDALDEHIKRYEHDYLLESTEPEEIRYGSA
ncbi:MAG: hypothetical protein ACREMY_11065 [bacterium]